MKPIPEIGRAEANQELCERLGLCWHEPVRTAQWPPPLDCVCRKCSEHIPKNPDFFSDSGKIQLLREMRERGMLGDFIQAIVFKTISTRAGIGWFINDFVLGDGGHLTRKALEFLRRE